MEELDEKDFEKMFRMDRDSFGTLLGMVRPNLTTSHAQWLNSSGSIIDPKTKLAVAIRWLAGGAVHDICFSFGISKKSFYKRAGVLWTTLDAINDVLDISFPISDPEKLAEIEKGFASYSFGRLRGCVMAIDGWVVRCRQPSSSEVDNVSSFRNRKVFFGLVVMAGVDSDCRFQMLSCKSPGSTNDSIAWEYTSVFASLHKLPPEYYIIGDEGFVNIETCLTPYPGKNLQPYYDSFNYHLSRMRQNVERAFGILVRKWGIFWRPLVCSHCRWAPIITAASKLHNFCIDARLKKMKSINDSDNRAYEADIRHGDMLEINTTD
ncbi:unnamed protein product, partial [Ectocarpus fasciculatus]